MTHVTGGSGLTIVWTAALLPFSFAVMVLSRDGDLRALDRLDWYLTIIFAVIAGPIAAAVAYIRERDRSRRGRSQ